MRRASIAVMAVTLLWPGARVYAQAPAPLAPLVLQASPGDSDKTLAAMRDEIERSRTRLQLEIPGQAQPARPYYIEYRLLDLDMRTVVAEFGSLVSSTTARNRFMNVDVRVGDYKVDSSNFITDEGFRGFLGSTGQVGIDRDYNSLRQDLWLATDQAFKQALDALSRKRAFLSSLAKQPDIDDFSREQPVVLVTPHAEPDWTTRNWEEEAKAVSAALRAFPQLYSTRVTYTLIYATTYLMSSEGTEIRASDTLAAVEASLETQATDGMPLHNLYARYVLRPAGLPAPDQVRSALVQAAQQLVALRTAPTAQDYDGPVLFEAPAAGSLLAQMLGPSLSGARPPLAMLPVFDQIMERMGGRSEWMGKIGTRVLPAGVNLVDDPTASQFQGQELIGGYKVDDGGVLGQKVTPVENGMLRDLLMSRRPGPDFDRSNGHARAAFLGDTRPTMSNLFFLPSSGEPPAELRKKFLEACKQNGQQWGLLVRMMDNPVLGIHHQEDLSDTIAGLAAGAATGDRLPLLMYRVSVADGHEELVRGARLTGLTLRALRNPAGIGNDLTVFSFAQSQAQGFAGTALAAFGTAQGGLPSSVVAPSLLFGEVEVRGARGSSRRLPLLPPPPLD